MSADDHSCKVAKEQVQRGCTWRLRIKRIIAETDLLLERCQFTPGQHSTFKPEYKLIWFLVFLMSSFDIREHSSFPFSLLADLYRIFS